MKNSWNDFLKERKNKAILLVSLLALLVTLFVFAQFLTYNEFRHGFILSDPILNCLSPVNVSIFTFVITYAFCALGLFVVLKTPLLFIRLLQAYTLMTLLRMLTLYLLPLDPPVGIIPLKDFFLQASFYSGRENLRDLFFSGHTTALFLFAFALKEKKLKITFVIVACVVGMLLMWQHVHYSVDVIVAPLVAYVVLKVQGMVARCY